MAETGPESVLTPEVARSLIRLETSKTGSPLTDDDLTQESLLRGLKAFRRAAYVEYPRAFFSKIVRDVVRDHWRRKREWLPLDSSDRSVPRHIPDLEEAIDRDRRLERIKCALGCLSKSQRELIESFYLYGYSIPQLSQRLGKSTTALKMELLRLRIRIRQMIAISKEDISVN